jgi:hypothetical protein
LKREIGTEVQVDSCEIALNVEEESELRLRDLSGLHLELSM